MVGTQSVRMLSWSSPSTVSSMLSRARLMSLKGMRIPASWMDMFSDLFESIKDTAFGLPSSTGFFFFFALGSSSAKRESSSPRSSPSTVPASSHTVPCTLCGCSLSQWSILSLRTALATFCAATMEAMPSEPGGGGGGGGPPPGGGGGAPGIRPPGGGGGGGGAPGIRPPGGGGGGGGAPGSFPPGGGGGGGGAPGSFPPGGGGGGGGGAPGSFPPGGGGGGGGGAPGRRPPGGGGGGGGTPGSRPPGGGGGGGGGGAPGSFPPGGGGGGAGAGAPPCAVGFEGDSSSSEPPSCRSMFLTTSSANFSRFSLSADDTRPSSSASEVAAESASLFAPLPIMFSAILPTSPPPVFFLPRSIVPARSRRFILTRLMICAMSSAVTLTSPSSSSFSLSTNLSSPPIAATSLRTRSRDVREYILTYSSASAGSAAP